MPGRDERPRRRGGPIAAGLLAAGVAIAGCSTPAIEDLAEPVASDASARTGQPVTLDPEEAARLAEDRVRAALEDGILDADEALAIALLGNPTLRARLEQLGIARAELVAATLPSNPMLDAELRFIEGGGEIVELSIVQELLDLLLMPSRRQVAEARIERVQRELVGTILDLAAETRLTYRRLQAQRQLVDLLHHATDATYLSALMAERLREAGNVPPGVVALQRAFHEEARIDLAAAETRVEILRGELAFLMGLTGERALDWEVPVRLPQPPPIEIPAARVESEAVARSVDLAAGHAEILALGRAAGIRRIEATLPELAAGGIAEREDDGTWVGGPIAALSIPVFDRGQAVSAEDAARLRRALHEHVARAQRVRHLARARYTEATGAGARATHMVESVLPLRAETTRRTQEQFNAMQVGVFRLLDAKRAELAAGRAAVQVLGEHWRARIELESILMGRMPRGGFGLQAGGMAGGGGGGPGMPSPGGGGGGGH